MTTIRPVQGSCSASSTRLLDDQKCYFVRCSVGSTADDSELPVQPHKFESLAACDDRSPISA